MNANFSRSLLALVTIGLVSLVGCSKRSKVEVIDLNKVLDIYDQLVKSKEDPEKSGSNELTAAKQENTQETQAFLTLFASELNKANLIKSTIGVDMQPSGIIRGFVDKDKNGQKSSSNSAEPELFTIEFDTAANRVIATQKVAGQQYRRDRRFGNAYLRYYFFHRMHSSMMYRQNRYYTGGRRRPNYSGFAMSSPNYHSAAVSRAQAVSRSSSRTSSRYSGRSSSRSSARGFGRSGSFSFGK